MRLAGVIFGTVATLFAAAGGTASASQLIDRNGSNIHLGADDQGHALLTYKAHGR